MYVSAHVYRHTQIKWPLSGPSHTPSVYPGLHAVLNTPHSIQLHLIPFQLGKYMEWKLISDITIRIIFKEQIFMQADIYACIYFMLHFRNHSQTLVLKLLLIAVINEPSVRSGSLTYRPLQPNPACLLFLQIWFIGMQTCPFTGIFYLLLLHNSGVEWLDR